MPLQATSGAASYDAFGGGAPVVPAYIEEVFNTFIYRGDGAARTITTDIDLSTKKGLIWIKGRTFGSDHQLYTTLLGGNKDIASNDTRALFTRSSPWLTFNSNGFSLSSNTVGNTVNPTDNDVVAWTFREQPKFFDVQTFTYPSSGSITVPHNLASTPGCVMVKVTDGVDGWYVYHRMANNGTNPSNYILQLNTTAGQINNFASWITVGSTSITFPSGALNPGSNFVMYLFAHDAGGFGLTGTDNVISCGTYTTDGSGNATVSLGYEPQFWLEKRANNTSNWNMFDSMRGMNNTDDFTLKANIGDSEVGQGVSIAAPTATGMAIQNRGASQTWIYIAIRRGPMKVPTDATKVFSPVAASNSSNYVVNAGFPPDTVLATIRDFTSGYNHSFFDRLRGKSNYLPSSSTQVESGVTADPTQQIADFSRNQNGIYISTGTVFAYSTLLGITYAWHNFRRAPSFFDEVCYTGTGTDDRQVTHNLGVAPELIICKSRDAAWPWWVGGSVLGSTRNGIYLNETGARQVNADAFSTNGSVFTSSYFLVSSVSAYPPNANGYKYVAYLFATCAGVSKVFSYTGNGSSQTINCGFTSGARFVMIKRTNSTGAWYVWDSARGIVSGNDPYFSMNTTAVEVTSDDSIDTNSTGFVVNQLSATDINVSSATYIGLAIA
jgi:hypothetical protein